MEKNSSIKDNFKSIGMIANRFKKIIDTGKQLTYLDVHKKLNVSENEYYAAVGWLARENKVSNTGFTLHFLDTDSDVKICNDAKKVWKVLETHGEVNITSIRKLTRIDSDEVFSALGWLARENKIDFHKKYIIKKKNIAKRLLKPGAFSTELTTKNKIAPCDKTEQSFQPVSIHENKIRILTEKMDERYAYPIRYKEQNYFVKKTKKGTIKIFEVFE